MTLSTSSYVGADCLDRVLDLPLLKTRLIGEGTFEAGKEKWVDVFGRPQVLQVLVICPNQELHLRTPKPVPPLLQSLIDHQQFSVSIVAIVLGGGQVV